MLETDSRRLFFFQDPFALKRNVARSLNSQMVFEYIQERFRTAYKYFACPQRKGTGGRQRSKKAGKQGAKLDEVERKEAACADKEEDDGKGEKSRSGHERSKDDKEPESDDEDGSDPSREKDEKMLVSLMDLVLGDGNKPTERPAITSLSPNGLLDSDKEGEDEDEEENIFSDKEGIVTSEDLHYLFDKMIFTGGKVMIMSHIHPFYTLF